MLKLVLNYRATLEIDQKDRVERRKLLDDLNMDPRIFALFLKDLFLKHEEGSWNTGDVENEYTWLKQCHLNAFRWEPKLNKPPCAYLKCPLCDHAGKIMIDWAGASPRKVTWSGIVDHVLRHFQSKEAKYECGRRYNQFYKAVNWKPRSAELLARELEKWNGILKNALQRGMISAYINKLALGRFVADSRIFLRG